MNNNRGQVLVLFLLLLPIIFLLVASIVDSSLMIYNKNKIDNISTDVLDSIKNKKDLVESDIITLYNLNDDDIVIDSIEMDAKTITVKSHKDIKPVFGKIIGFKKYTVKSEKKVDYNSKLLIYLENNDNKITSYDGNNYTVVDNKINLSSIDLTSKTLEIGLTNQDNDLLTIGNNKLYIYTYNLYLNDTFLVSLKNRNILHIVENKVYLNEKYIKDISIMTGDFTIDISNIKYLKVYDELLTNGRIRNINNLNRSWLDEE